MSVEPTRTPSTEASAAKRPSIKSSRRRLNRFSLRYFSGDNLFAAVGRAVCRAETLPRRELFESWEVAKRIRDQARGRPIYELAAGHGFLAALMLILDESIPHAVCVDRSKPLSHDRLVEALVEDWPRLRGRVLYREEAIEGVEIPPEALAVSVHGCGSVTDTVLDKALAVRCPVAVLPCCHDFDKSEDGGLGGWLGSRLAIDVARANRLTAAGYEITTTTIPDEITQRNRLLIGGPRPTINAERS